MVLSEWLRHGHEGNLRPVDSGREYDRPMSFRHGIVLILAVLAGAALAAVAEGQGSGTATGVGTATTGTVSPSPETPGTTSPPSNELTHPQIQPTSGDGLTVFTLTFTLREAPGHEGVMAIDYRVQVTAPPGAGGSCMGAQPAAIESGTAGALERITLAPPAGGWCGGTYRVTVYLQRGPYCPPPAEGQQPVPCPEFATQDLDTGSASFTVGSGAPLVSVPRLRGLKPLTANRRLKRRHLRVRYTALSNLCAGIPPTGGSSCRNQRRARRCRAAQGCWCRPVAAADRRSRSRWRR
jgi:hypothetical protein